VATLGERVVTRVFLEGLSYCSHSYLPLSITSSLPSPHLLGHQLEIIDPKRECTSFDGKKGLKSYRPVSEKR
jgi:hypothetical protein